MWYLYVKDFYFFYEENLSKPDDISNLSIDVEKSEPLTETEIENTKNLFLPMIDNIISNRDKNTLLKNLQKDKDLRERFVEFENFELISKMTANDKTILGDSVLGIVGAQDVFEAPDLTKKEEKAEARIWLC